MIDKITPRPDDSVRDMLITAGLEDMHNIVTQKNTYIAPFVNAEETQYLVIEDAFPNGKPALEKAGVLFTDKETVDKVEKMKVCTCLNPLHTSMAIFGCLFGYTRISDEMNDIDIVKLIEGVGYIEGLPVVVDPVIINPRNFIDEVIKIRLPNPFMPDTPQRISMDCSIKIPIRFGETLKTYKNSGKSFPNLKYIPLVFAGWLRYLLGIDDQGNKFEISPDPNLNILLTTLSGIKLGEIESINDKLQPILSNPTYFGVNLYEFDNTEISLGSLGSLVEELFKEMLSGIGAVRKILTKVVSKSS
jgi:fructuronate reductase